VTPNTAISPGDVLLSQVVAPNSFQGTRLYQMSKLFERYQVNHWSFNYISAVAATNVGQLLMYPEYDVADPATNDLQQAMAHMDSVLFNIYTSSSCEFVKADPFTDLFTDPTGDDPRLSAVGKLIMLAVANIPTNTSIGSIFMDYDITFYVPQLESTAEVDQSLLRTIQNGVTVRATAPAERLAVAIQNSGLGPVLVKGGDLFTGTAFPIVSGLTLDGTPLAPFQVFEFAAKAALRGGDQDITDRLNIFKNLAQATSSQADESTFMSSRLVNASGGAIGTNVDVLKFVNVTRAPCCSSDII
jgi:hypothetical protein